MPKNLINEKNLKNFTVDSSSTMSRKDKVIYLILTLIGFSFAIRYAIWWFEPNHIPSNWLKGELSPFHFLDFLLFGILSFTVFIGIFLKLGSWFTIWFMRRPHPTPPEENLRVAFITCYVPGDEPLEMLEETLLAMRNAKYQHDTWVLDEGDNEGVKEICKRLNIKHFTRKNKPHYNLDSGFYRVKTKAGNLNAWRNEFEENYDIVAQVDMDHVPHEDYLIKQLGYFKDEKVGFVGIPQVYKNTSNWIARGASEQTHFYYGPMQQGFYGSHMPFFVGTTHVYRVKAMRGFGGYSPTIAEDYLTGMHFYSHGWKGVYVPEILAEGHGPIDWKGYFSQQMRWSYGLYEILFRHTRKHFLKVTHRQKINLFFSQMFYFTGLSTFFGFMLTALYLFFGLNPTNMQLVEWAYYSLPAYASGMAIMFFLHKYYIDSKNSSWIGVRGLLLSQAANLIYTLALFKFLTKQKLYYTVTPKQKNTSTSEKTWTLFTFHIFIILLSVFALEISILRGFDSIVMRFWAIYTVIIFSLILLSAFWRKLLKKIKNIFLFITLAKDINDIDSKEIAKSQHLLDYDKYGYVIKNPLKIRVLYSLGIIFWVLTLYGFSFFLNLNIIYWLFFGPVLGIITFHNLLNYGINIFYKKFDINKHEDLVSKYWSLVKDDKPLVDIFIPVCGEDLAILNATFGAASRINYKNKKIYILDDKGEAWVEDLAGKFNFTYLSRPNKGEMKKAGNLLYGFKHGRGEFYAVFDADFCPHPDFIHDLLPYMSDPKIAIVQSPHYFEISGTVHKRSPIEYGSANLQEQFFRTIQVARDRFEGAICAGSNTIYRRSVLEMNGGPAQVDHGEDVNTGIDIINLGYKVKYVPVILAKGLSPDTLQAFYKQQNRWASSSTGLLLSGRIFKSKLTFLQKLCYLSGISYYLSQTVYFLLPFQLFVLLGFHAQKLNLLHALPFLPYMLFSMIALPLFSRKSKPKFGTYLAVISSVYVHCYTIILRFLGRPATWVPTNTIGSGIERGFMYLNEFSLVFLSAYLVGVSYLVYRWNLPIFNGVFIALIFWLAWNVIIHLVYFYHSYIVLYEKKALNALKSHAHKKHFYLWRTRTLGQIIIVLAILIGSGIYAAQVTDSKFLFSTREEIIASNLTSSTKENVLGARTNEKALIIKNTINKNKMINSVREYPELIEYGSTYTNLARKVILKFIHDNNIDLNSREKLLAESRLAQEYSIKPLKIGEVVVFKYVDIASSIQKSKE